MAEKERATQSAAPGTQCKDTKFSPFPKGSDGEKVVKNILRAVTESEERRNEEFSQYFLSFSKPVKPVEYLLNSGGVGAFPRRNVVVFAGKKKNGKTKFGEACCAGMLGASWGGFTSTTPNAKGIYYNLEMDEADAMEVIRNIHALCGWSLTDNERMRVAHLRRLSYEERKEYIDKTIRHYRPDFVVIDGIADIQPDFNDLQASADTVLWLTQLADENNCCAIVVLHENKGDGNTQGHLGTVLDKKMYQSFHVEKRGATFTATSISRGKECAPISFILDNDGVPRADTTNITAFTAQVYVNDVKATMEKVFAGKSVMRYGEMRTAYKGLSGCRSDSTAEAKIRLAVENRIILKADNGCYTLNLPQPQSTPN